MRKRILIVDDDHDFRQAVAMLLEHSGYEVLSSANGNQGVRMASQKAPDLILMDMVMSHRTDGAVAARAIADDAALRNVPVIMVTGAGKGYGYDFAIKPDEVNLPVRMILDKPVNPDVLLKVIHDELEEFGAKRECDPKEIERLAGQWNGKPGALVMVLHRIQNEYGYVPREAAFELSRIMGEPLARIYEVMTFYTYFREGKPAKHNISVCMGTACYLKGAGKILDELKKILKAGEGQNTEDGLFRLESVRCLGCCGLAPVLSIDGRIFGKVKPEELECILDNYRKK